MIIFPAIDILNKRAVRLLHGKKSEVTDYGNPVERAMLWKEQGAKYLHVVDLDGAFNSLPLSDKIISEIVKTVEIPVQSGGGLRSLDDIKKRFDSGVDRVILGTIAYQNLEILKNAVKLYGDKIVIGIDAKDGFISVSGWTEKTEIEAVDFGKKMKDLGINTTVFTDISRDGALTGVNLEATIKMQEESKLMTIASGGMSSLEDVKKLKLKNIYGAILGKSIYVGKINLKEAIEVANAL